MTDYIARDKDRVFVFGSTSMFEYRIEVDDNDNELLDLFKIWQSSYLSEKNKDDVRASLKSSAGKPSKGSSDGNDYILRRGDRVFVFGDVGMFEYRWNVDQNGNEVCELFKHWKAKDITEDIKDKIRENVKNKNEGKTTAKADTQPLSSTTNETTAGVDASLDDGKKGKP